MKKVQFGQKFYTTFYEFPELQPYHRFENSDIKTQVFFQCCSNKIVVPGRESKNKNNIKD